MTELLQVKTELIAQYLLPVLGSLPVASGLALTEQLVTHSQLRQSVARQYLDEPGPADAGQAIVMPQSVAHSFQVVDGADGIKHIGTHVWARRTLIFDSYALLDGADRTDFVQTLEPGPYLSIQYPILRRLIADHSVVDRAIVVLARKQERQRRLHDHLLHLTPGERVAAFETRYKAYIHVATIEQRCMHIGLTRQTYSKKLKALNLS
ncbi:hypothetical protein [Parapedobacter sp. 10938]|uniref:hypothetical protein n=1 Tax=Parapedobacter flavus TaxID=3110225 RepID=UPI002DBD686B|nr:hypothetical protein [Parapedobacter sp. 10938]MEC3879134.1 hypothetical protein [Parapedobacter sp. 10938]